MAVRVIHFLEVVYIQHQQQGGFSGTGDNLNAALQHRVELAPVGQARERILERELAQAIDDALQIMQTDGGRDG